MIAQFIDFSMLNSLYDVNLLYTTSPLLCTWISIHKCHDSYEKIATCPPIICTVCNMWVQRFVLLLVATFLAKIYEIIFSLGWCLTYWCFKVWRWCRQCNQGMQYPEEENVSFYAGFEGKCYSLAWTFWTRIAWKY